MSLNHISHVLRAIWKNWIFNIWKQLKKIKLFNPPFTYNLIQNMFKILHFGVKFCDLAQVGESKVPYIASSNILAANNNPLKDLPLRFLFCHENNRL